MSIYERLFHAILFEVIAVILTVLGLLLFTEHSMVALSSTVILISCMAMVWNVIFNYIFDKFYPESRETRGLKIRVMYAILFEGGLLCMTLPVVAYILKISLWQAFILDFAMTLFIMVYTVIFNWIYDHARLKWVNHKEHG